MIITVSSSLKMHEPDSFLLYLKPRLCFGYSSSLCNEGNLMHKMFEQFRMKNVLNDLQFKFCLESIFFNSEMVCYIFAAFFVSFCSPLTCNIHLSLISGVSNFLNIKYGLFTFGTFWCKYIQQSQLLLLGETLLLLFLFIFISTHPTLHTQ